MRFSQHNPRWADRRVGTGRLTLDRTGCLVCAATGVLTEADVDTNPGRLNRWLGRHGGFASGNLFVFSAIEPLGVVLDAVVDCSRVPAPMGRVEETLGAGGWVLAKVDFSPWTPVVNQHWVEVLEATDTDCAIADPWLPPGSEEIALMARYARASWPGPARAILRLALYLPLLSPPPLSVSLVARGQQVVAREQQERRWPRLNWKRGK